MRFIRRCLYCFDAINQMFCYAHHKKHLHQACDIKIVWSLQETIKNLKVRTQFESLIHLKIDQIDMSVLKISIKIFHLWQSINVSSNRLKFYPQINLIFNFNFNLLLLNESPFGKVILSSTIGLFLFTFFYNYLT